MRKPLSYRTVRYALLCAPLLLTGCPQPPETDVEYHVLDLSTYGFATSFTSDINEWGRVLGWARSTSQSQYHPFIWNEGYGTTVLPVSFGWAYPIYPTVMNDHCDVAGVYMTSSGRHAFIWDQGNGMRDLGSLGGITWVTAIKDASSWLGPVQVVGHSYLDSSQDSEHRHAFIWDEANGMRDLGTLQPQQSSHCCSFASAINDYGQVIGCSYSNYLQRITHRGFIWDEYNGMRDLGTLEPNNSTCSTLPQDINTSGQVVGWAETSVGSRAFIWDEANGIRDLGTLEGRDIKATLITWDGQVAGYTIGGYTGVGGENDRHAFIWDEANGMRDLGTLQGDETIPSAISTGRRAVVGRAFNKSDYKWYAFIWDEANGLRNLNDLIPPHPGWRLSASSDHRVDIDPAGIIAVTSVNEQDTYQTTALVLWPTK